MRRSTLINLTLDGLAVALATVSLMVPGLALLTVPAVVLGAVGLGMHLHDALTQDDQPPPRRRRTRADASDSDAALFETVKDGIPRPDTERNRMSAGDNTKDNRWRPGFASSERRVREELEPPAEHHVFSRELAFVPAQRTPKSEAHDAQICALIAQHARREQLRHGHSVGQRLKRWRWLDAMHGAREKQAYSHCSPTRAATRPSTRTPCSFS